MRKSILIGWLCFLAALILIGGSGLAHAQEGPLPAHAAITEYTGPETCAACHLTAGQEVVNSLHYQHQAEVPFREGWDEDELGGMYVTY